MIGIGEGGCILGFHLELSNELPHDYVRSERVFFIFYLWSWRHYKTDLNFGDDRFSATDIVMFFS